MPSYDKSDIIAALQGRFIDFYEDHGTVLRPSGDENRGSCPLHHGTGPSFSVNPETGLWRCHSKCQAGGDVFTFVQEAASLDFQEALQYVAAWAGATEASRQTKPATRKPAGATPRVVATYDYTDEQGTLLYQVQRWEPGKDGEAKDFRQRRPNGKGWVYKLGDVRRAPYRLPEVLSAMAAGKPVYICEGEKAADALRSLGVTATCNSGGAGNWTAEAAQTLCGAGVVILPDIAAAGQKHAQKTAALLHGTAKRVRVVNLPGLPPKGDAVEWTAAGGTLEDLVQLVKATSDWHPAPTESVAPASPALPQTQGATAWEDPVLFAAHDLPGFPLVALPDAVAHYVSEVSASSQVPTDMAAVVALAVVAAAGARRCVVQVGHTHTEPLNLYTSVIMESGSRKSAMDTQMPAPLREWEREAAAAMSGEAAGARERRSVEDKRMGFLREQAAKAKSVGDRERQMEELEQLAAGLTEVPAMPRLLADDVTPEKLPGLMAEQGGAMAIFSAEGGLFGILAGRYNDGKANLDLFLKAHAGEEYRVDRTGRPSEFLPHACLTLGLLVQPSVLESLSDTPAFRGRGLLGRFLYCLPESLVGTRLYNNRPVDAHKRDRYCRAIRAILDLPEAGTAADPQARHVLRLEGEALEVWAAYYNDVERRQADGGDLSGIRDWASKLAGAVARIAGGFHLVKHSSSGHPWALPIARETLVAAWAVGEYLIPHALAAFGQMGADPHVARARRLLRWVNREGRSEFTLRDCHQSHRTLTAQDLQAALHLLVERGFLRLQEARRAEGSGRPRGPVYEVNPYSQNTQNTQN